MHKYWTTAFCFSFVNFLVSDKITLDYRRNPVGISEFQGKTRIYPCFLLLSMDNLLTKGFRKKNLLMTRPNKALYFNFGALILPL